MGALGQAQRVAAVAKAAVDTRDHAPARVVDPAHRVDQLGEVFEVDFHHVVDGDAEVALDHRDRKRRSPEGVGGVDLLQSVGRNGHDGVARDREPCAVAGSRADEHDRVGAARTAGIRPRFPGVLLASV